MATAQEMKFSIKDFFSKYDQIRSFLQMATLQCAQHKLYMTRSFNSRYN